MVSKFSPILLAILAAAATAAPSHKILPYSYTQSDLPNGLRLIVVPTDFPNIVATYIVVQAGARNEVEAGHTGFAHLFEHVMFKGTAKVPTSRYDQVLQQIGASSNAFTSDDFTCYYTVFSKEDLPAVLEMEADRFQNLKYTEAEFKTESLAVLGEYNKNSSNPFNKLSETLRATAYSRSTYQHTAMGFLKDIQDMPNQYDYSLKFFDRYYRPEYTTILVVGDVKAKPVRELVDQYWGEWKRGSYTAEIPQEPPQTEPRSAEVKWPGPTLPVMTIAFKSPAYTDSAKDTAALDALAALAFSSNSDLYQKLVVQEQKLDALFAQVPSRVDAGLFQVSARIKKEADINGVRDEILAAIRGFQEKPVDSARLDAVRKRLRYSVATQMQSADAVASILASFVGLRRSPETINKLHEQYASLTPEDVKQAAAKYLTENSRTIVTLTMGGGK